MGKNSKLYLNDEQREILRNLRKRCGLTVEEVSLESGHSKSWLGQIERGLLSSVKEKDYNFLVDKYNTTLMEFNDMESVLRSASVEKKPYNRYYLHGKMETDITSAVSKIDSLFNSIDFSNSESVKKDMSCLETLLCLLNTLDGYQIFKTLFRLPLHRINPRDLKEIYDMIDKMIPYEYVVEENGDVKSLSCRIKESELPE